MPRFRTIPNVVEAMRFTGDNVGEIADLTGYVPDYGRDDYHDALVIETPEGDLTANVGDWIVKGAQGGIAPCRPEVFALIYESVDGDEVDS